MGVKSLNETQIPTQTNKNLCTSALASLYWKNKSEDLYRKGCHFGAYTSTQRHAVGFSIWGELAPLYCVGVGGGRT